MCHGRFEFTDSRGKYAISFRHVLSALTIVSSHLFSAAAVCRSADWERAATNVEHSRRFDSRQMAPTTEVGRAVDVDPAAWSVFHPHGLMPVDPAARRTWWSPFGKLDFHRAHDHGSPLWVSRVPGEFEQQEALVLAAGGLAEEYPAILSSIITAAQRRIKLVGLVANSQKRKAVLQMLRRTGLPSSALILIETPHDTIWVRDYGPVFVQTSGTQRVAMDAEYVCPDRAWDNEAPAVIAPLFHCTVVRLPMVLEGGNFLSNGQGICLTTTKTLGQNAEAVVSRTFGECFGSNQTVFLEPLSREPTGHVDMFALFTAPNVVVIGAYQPNVDPENAEILDRNALRLAGLPTTHGPLQVVRIPMPDNRDGLWRTYLNVVFANGALLVPVYPDANPAVERTALETFRRLLPAWSLASINVSEMIGAGGALHCIVANVPRAPPPNRTALSPQSDSRASSLGTIHLSD